MNLPIVLREEAEAEFDEAFDWYDAQRAGLGAAFAAEIQAAFDRIAASPTAYREVLADIRRGAVRRFPYSVYYRSHADRIEIVAVFHVRRDPQVWQRRA